jgi:hypothetical protein
VGAKHDRIVTVTLQQVTVLSLRAIDRANDGLEGRGHDVGIDSHSPKDFASHRALEVRGCSGIATSRQRVFVVIQHANIKALGGQSLDKRSNRTVSGAINH